MAERVFQSFGTIRLEPKTVAEVEAVTYPRDGQMAYATDDSASGHCIVFYDASVPQWTVVETGAAMTDA